MQTVEDILDDMEIQTEARNPLLGLDDAKKRVIEATAKALSAKVTSVNLTRVSSGEFSVFFGPTGGRKGSQTVLGSSLKDLAKIPIKTITFDRDGPFVVFKA